jgi:hypothetical protein
MTAKSTTGGVGSKEPEVAAALVSWGANVMIRTGGVDAGTGANVNAGAGMDTVDKLCLTSGSPHCATTSCCSFPSRGCVNVAVEVMSCGAGGTSPIGNGSTGRGLE